MEVVRINEKKIVGMLLKIFKIPFTCLLLVVPFSRKVLVGLIVSIISAQSALFAQLPANVLAGYHENWKNVAITAGHANYNVINLAFALPTTNGCTCSMYYTRPPAYATDAAFMAAIDVLHSSGKKVLLSIGGATGPVYLANATDRATFETTTLAILAQYSYKIDGLDLDLETTSMSNIPGTWTMGAPAAAQTNMVTAIKNIMVSYQAATGKKMLLTAAPEVYYLNGALSSYQVGNSGGKFLPILEGLRNEMDLLYMQLYNTPGGVNDWNGVTRYEGTGDFVTSMNETIVRGFTLLGGKGTFSGWPANKIAFGLPANASGSTAGSGFVSYTDICNAVKYFKGTIAKPAGWNYTMTAAYPTLRGLMTWSINEDQTSSSPAWAFATNYVCGFPVSAPVTLISFTGKRAGDQVHLNWSTATEINNDYFSVERSSDGINFSQIANIKGHGNSTSILQYRYSDTNPLAEQSYYRLAQYDFDGTLEHSQVIEVAPSDGLSNGLLILNNPFSETLSIMPYGSAGEEEGNLTVTDCSGRIVLTKQVRMNEEYSIGQEYPSGFYVLQYLFNGETKRYKVLKQ